MAAVFAAMAGRDTLDATTQDVPGPQIRLDNGSDLKGVRIGVPQEYFIKGIQPEVEEKVRAAIGVLRRDHAQDRR